MGLGDFFNRQFAEVISWENPSPEALLYKYPSATNEIKDASKLIVAPGQGAILVYEGAVSDTITEPGIYNLETDNHPFITTLLRLRTAFESEHKMGIFFYRTTEVVGQGWGTASPAKYVDPVYGFPVELGANGSFSFEISNAMYLFTEVVGTRDAYNVSEARKLLQSRFPQAISQVLATAGISYQNIDSQLSRLAELITAQLTPELSRLGFGLTDFKLNGTQFDDGTKSRIDQVSNVLAESLAAGKGRLTYVEGEKLKALRDAARNEGGLAGAGLQLGAGMELGKNFAGAKEEQLNASPADPVEKLRQLKLLLDEGIITQEDFDAKKKEWLSKM